MIHHSGVIGGRAHHRELVAECDRLITFAQGSAHPAGGFAWLDDCGRHLRDRSVQTWITCRMTHVFALGHLLGRPGCADLADHGVSALNGLLRDADHGGWYAASGTEGPTVTDKRAYEHAFVVLAAGSAAAAGRPGAETLLGEALDVVDQRFWDEDDGLVVDVWDRAWERLEPYRGVNANMHTVEAFIAAADITGDEVWRERSLRVVEQVVHGWARHRNWMLPEHFDEAWHPLLDYNQDDPGHPFRPYGVTIGHLFEWARLALHVRAALRDAAPGWLLDDARQLFAAAVRHGWSVDGGDGFVYTVDYDGTPVVRDRMHWVVAEALAAAAALHHATGDSAYDSAYRTWWGHARQWFIDLKHGSWHHQLDPAGRPASTVWSGKPDVYHALQAVLIPRLPLTPALAPALTRPDHEASV